MMYKEIHEESILDFRRLKPLYEMTIKGHVMRYNCGKLLDTITIDGAEAYLKNGSYCWDKKGEFPLFKYPPLKDPDVGVKIRSHESKKV